MVQRKLLNIFNKIDITILEDFVKYLNSEYYNNNIALTSLAKLIKTHHQKYHKSNFTDTYTYQMVFNETAYNESKLNKLYTLLNKKFEDFIYQHFNYASETEKNLKVASFYFTIDEYDIAHKLLHKADELLQNSIEFDKHYYYENHLLKSIQNGFETSIDNRKKENNLVEYNLSIDQDIIFKKLVSFLLINSKKNMFNIQIELTLKEAIYAHIQATNYVNSKSIEILYKTNLLYENDLNEQAYLAVLELVISEGRILNNSNLYNVCGVLTGVKPNLFVDRERYFNSLFRIYKFQIENHVLFIEKHLQATLFSNIITVCIRLKEFDFALAFIEKYQHYLYEAIREDYVSYNQLKLAFAMKKYTDCLALLNTIKYTDTDIKLGARCIQMKTYYELKEWNLLDNSLNTFKVFIHRLDDLNEYHKNIHNNFVLSFIKVYKCKMNPDIKTISHTIEIIQKEMNIIEKVWLLEKLHEMK